MLITLTITNTRDLGDPHHVIPRVYFLHTLHFPSGEIRHGKRRRKCAYPLIVVIPILNESIWPAPRVWRPPRGGLQATLTRS